MAPHGSMGEVLERADPAVARLLDEFQLDVQVTVDAPGGHTTRACDSSDTCGSTCGSACVSS